MRSYYCSSCATDIKRGTLWNGTAYNGIFRKDHESKISGLHPSRAYYKFRRTWVSQEEYHEFDQLYKYISSKRGRNDVKAREKYFFICDECVPKVDQAYEENKRLAEEDAKRVAEEEKAIEKRTKIESYKKAGIPEGIVNLWVEDEISKTDMLKLLSIFKDSLKDYTHLVVKVAKSEHVPLFSDDENVDQWAAKLQNYVNQIGFDWVTLFIEQKLDAKDIPFIEELRENPEFLPLELAIIEKNVTVEKASHLYFECGFSEHPAPLQEVLDGADWVAVAVKHGFYQL